MKNLILVILILCLIISCAPMEQIESKNINGENIRLIEYSVNDDGIAANITYEFEGELRTHAVSFFQYYKRHDDGEYLMVSDFMPYHFSSLERNNRGQSAPFPHGWAGKAQITQVGELLKMEVFEIK